MVQRPVNLSKDHEFGMGQPKAGLMTGRLSTVTRESGVDMEIWRGGFLFI